jgi:predicted nucleic acid-binding protein
MRKVGRQIALIDAFTAVIALRQNLVLLTTDNDFQGIPALKQENWLLPVGNIYNTD